MTALPAPRPRLRLVPDYRRTVAPLDDAELVRYYDVISADGTRLRAWTNDTDGSLEEAGAPVVLRGRTDETELFAPSGDQAVESR